MARTKRPVTPTAQTSPTRVADSGRDFVGGVDTHKDTHTAAVIDTAGRMLGHETFPATGAGYVQLLDWLVGFGQLLLVGIEGTGAYGSGLAAHLRQAGVGMVEVDRPDRKARRWQGKSDPVDAEAAARAALAARATGTPMRRQFNRDVDRLVPGVNQSQGSPDLCLRRGPANHRTRPTCPHPHRRRLKN
jgi:transposase